MDFWPIGLTILLILALIIGTIVIYYVTCHKNANKKTYNVSDPRLSINSIQVLIRNTGSVFRKFSDKSEESEDLLDSTDVSERFEKSVLRLESDANLKSEEQQFCVSSEPYYSPCVAVTGCPCDAKVVNEVI